MAKEYKAFISYRHLPADSRIAERVHRGVEHYRIPRKLDPQGKRRFGRVFRDKEELPLAVNLTGSIHEALDHAEYLIVICSPETPKSQWVREEIRYFLKNHDLDHVMAVLVEGEPYESYPPELLHRYAPDGVTVLENVEPIAADVRGSTRQEVERKIPREFLRIYARMLGCDFDDLYRREQRYRARRAVAAAVAIAVVSALFIGMLLNRNAQIQQQMLVAQENESRALAALSRSAHREGDYRGALNKALDALPGRNGQRPYVPEAEYALCDELNLFGWDELGYVQSLDMSTSVTDCRVSAERNMLVTLDGYNCVRASDLATGEELWSWQAETDIFSPCLREDLGMLLLKGGGVTALSLDSGKLLWQVKDEQAESSLSDGTLALCFNTYTDDEGALKDSARTLNLRNGRLGRRHPTVNSLSVDMAAVSPDGRYAAILQGEGTTNTVILLDLESGRQKRLEGEYPDGFPNCYYEMHFTPGGDLVMGCAAAFTVTEEIGRTGFVVCYDREQDWALRFDTDLPLNNDTVLVNGGYNYLPELQVFACADFGLLIGGDQEMVLLDYETGEIQWEKRLPAIICDVCVYQNSMGLVLSDGTVTFCSEDGLLGLDYGLYTFQADYGLYAARVSGERFLDSVFVMIPAEEHRRVSVVRAKEPENVTEILQREELGTQGVLFSPNGRWLASLDSDGESLGICGTLMDLTGEEESIRFCVEELAYYYVQRDSCQLLNDGRILTAFGVIDPRTNEIRGMTCSGELPDLLLSSRSAAFALRADGTAISGCADQDQEGLWHLLLWQDGEQTGDVPVPEELGRLQSCVAVGAQGCVLLNADFLSQDAQNYHVYDPEEDAWIPLGESLSGQLLAYGLADSHRWLAAAEENGSITLLDLQAKKPLRSWEYDLPAESIEKLMFAREDQLLLAFSSEGDLSIFDTATGEKLGYAYYGDRLLRFHNEARYRFYEIEDQERCLIVYSDQRYTEGAGLLLDRRSWLPVGVYSGVESYDPETGELILLPDVGPLFRGKLPSLEELTERAEAILVDNGSLPAAKEEG